MAFFFFNFNFFLVILVTILSFFVLLRYMGFEFLTVFIGNKLLVKTCKNSIFGSSVNLLFSFVGSVFFNGYVYNVGGFCVLCDWN